MDQTRYKITMVDDNLSTLNQGKTLLNALYKVNTIQSPVTLFENLKNDIPDLILLDVEMPEMNGFEVIKELKDDVRYKDIPVIFLTSKSDEESEREGFRLGAVDYVTKPFSAPLLQKRISNQISYKQVQTTAKVYASYLDAMENEMAEANERLRIMLDSTPMCSHLWDRNLNMVYCNEVAVRLYGFESKKDCAKRFLKECSVEYQPDGQLSDVKGPKLLDKAFKEGRCVFDWMTQMPDGTPMPVEVTFVRVTYKDDYHVIGYIRDLREVTILKAEAEKAYYDGLTGIYNRRYFDEKLERSIKMLSRSGGTLSLMMVDIDFFKNYNDRYGHYEGDICLKTIAETLAGTITRADDFVARYGGEEFAVVLPNTDEQGARFIVEKLLENILNCKIPHEKNDGVNYVTVSVGVVTGKTKHPQTAEDYIKRADEMLYLSKQNGRNRYSFSHL